MLESEAEGIYGAMLRAVYCMLRTARAITSGVTDAQREPRHLSCLHNYAGALSYYSRPPHCTH
jgi:hypothetical protein